MASDNKEDKNVEESKAPLISHLIELRDRLKWAALAFFVAFLISYIFKIHIYGFLVKPLGQIYIEMGVENPRMIYTGLTEAFFTYLKVSFYAGLFVSFPILASQIYKFAAPGLYKNERKAFLPFLIATPVLFALGAALVYFFIFPVAWKFFLSFQTTAIETGGLAIELEAKVNEYLSLVLKLMFAFGLAFQLPVAVSLLARAGLVTAKGMKRNRKYAIVCVFSIAAILTPPDIISQIGLGIPILILYEISIYLAVLMENKRRAKDMEDNNAKSDLDEETDVDDIPETDFNDEE